MKAIRIAQVLIGLVAGFFILVAPPTGNTHLMLIMMVLTILAALAGLPRQPQPVSTGKSTKRQLRSLLWVLFISLIGMSHSFAMSHEPDALARLQDGLLQETYFRLLVAICWGLAIALIVQNSVERQPATAAWRDE